MCSFTSARIGTPGRVVELCSMPCDGFLRCSSSARVAVAPICLALIGAYGITSAWPMVRSFSCFIVARLAA